MKGMTKIFGVFLVLLASFLMLSNNAYADDPYEIQKVKVCDIGVVSEGDAVYVERGTSCLIEVYLRGNDDVDNVRVKAWIGGYEYDDVEDRTEIFSVEPGVKYKKYLRLDLPEDMEASDDYVLHVEAYDDDNRVNEDLSYILRIKETRHLLAIRDIVVRPGTSVDAGRPLFVTVRVENMGAKKEEDVRVNVAIPELGVSARDYIDELTAYEIDNEDEEDSMSSNEIFLRLPENAATGDYELVVSVEYNRGHDVSEAVELIHVNGVDVEQEEGTYLITVDSTKKGANLGSEVGFKVMIANLNAKEHVYSVEVAGEKLFADSRVENNNVRIQKDSTGEVLVFLKATEAGSHNFNIRVLSDGVVVSEESLTLEVNGQGIDTRNVLLIGFVVLVVILIILGLIVAFSKMRNEESGEEYY